MSQPHDPFDVLAFWWQAGPQAWFAGKADFDAACASRCGSAHEAAGAGLLKDWANAPHSALALILLLDQIPRNIYRGTARMFATDAKALSVAQAALDRRFHLAYPQPARRFFYIPFMHAEDIAHQERCIDLCRADDDSEGYRYALIHMDPIRRFGRFPHRNAILGRESTPTETAYLESGGFDG